jgi:acetyl-CoA acetyltransferase
MGGVPAARKVLAKAGLDSSDIDLIEINEAFGPFFCGKKSPQ